VNTDPQYSLLEPEYTSVNLLIASILCRFVIPLVNELSAVMTLGQ